jgi:hypothetical protein
VAEAAEAGTAPRPIRTSAFRPRLQTSTATTLTAKTSRSLPPTRTDLTAMAMGSAVNPNRLHAASALSNDHGSEGITREVLMVKMIMALSLACLLTLSSTGLASDSWVVTRGDGREGGRLDLKTVFVGKNLAGFRTHKRFRGRYLKGERRSVSFALDTKGDRKWDYGIYFDRFDITTCLLAGGRYHEDLES